MKSLNENFGIGEMVGTAAKIATAPIYGAYKLIKGAGKTELGQMAILYGEKKYMHYKRSEDPVGFINDNIKLTKIFSEENFYKS